MRRKLGVEDIRCDNVADGVGGVEGGVVRRLLGLSGAVAAHPGDEQRVEGVDKRDQVVSDEETGFVGLCLWQRNHQGDTDNDERNDAEEEVRLALERVCEVGRGEDGDELQRAKGHVEQNGLVGGEADEALQDDGAEDGRHGCAGIDGNDHDHVEPVLGLAPRLEHLLEVELVRHDTLLVGL